MSIKMLPYYKKIFIYLYVGILGMACNALMNKYPPHKTLFFFVKDYSRENPSNV
jgi:hypothetical protein